MSASKIDARQIQRAYDSWAPFYDLTFGLFAKRGRQAAVAAADVAGARVLEVGVGTGISLPDYKNAAEIVGIDFSESMLEEAHKLVKDRRLSGKVSLCQMDAHHLAFKSGSFDVVVAMYVITTVSDPEQCLDEMLRVLNGGGVIILKNNFAPETLWKILLAKAVAPICRMIGWDNTAFQMSRLEKWVDAHGLTMQRPVRVSNWVVEQFTTFRMVCIIKTT